MPYNGEGNDMITLKIDEVDRILTVEMEGLISEADLDGAIDALQSKYPAVGVRGGFSMCIDWHKLEGWEKGAKTVGMITAKAIGDAVRRVAVIADAKWSDEQPRVADAAKQAQVRFFSPEQREGALAWLRKP
jgi:hypothetical protein